MLRKWVLVASLVGATIMGGAGLTLALFTDHADTEEPARFVAGTLNLQGDRDQGDSIPGPMFYIDAEEDGRAGNGEPGKYPTGLWAPGDAHHRVFQIENIGTLAAKITRLSAKLEEGDLEFASILDVKIYDGALLDPDGTLLLPEPNLIYEGQLGDFFDTGVELSDPIVLEPYDEDWGAGGLAEFGILVSFPREAGNRYQGDSIKVTFSAYAEQAKNNP